METGTWRRKIAWAGSFALIIISVVMIHSLLFGAAHSPESEKIPSVASHNAGERLRIKSIDIQGLSRIREEELRDLITLEEGDVFDRQELAKGIQRAFRKNIFLDIIVYSEPVDGGIELTYVVNEVPLVKKIRIMGNRHISTKNILRRLVYTKGGEYRAALKDQARDLLLQHYRKKGFPEAHITISDSPADDKNRVSIVVDIAEGSPLVIRSLQVTEDVRSLIKTGEGDIFDQEDLDSDVERIRQYFRKKGYLKPVVGPYRYNNGTLELPVKTGPKIEIVFINNGSISTKTLRKAVPFLEEEDVSDEIIAEAVNRIRNLYRAKGYYQASVAAAVEQREDVKVTFLIQQGEKVILRDVTFEGMSIPRTAVMKILSLREGKPYNDDSLDENVQKLTDFYHGLGYIEMKVEDISKSFDVGQKDIDLHFVLHEGPQIRLGAVSVEGNSIIRTNEIMQTVALNEGSPYNIIDINDARYRVLSLYAQKGFADAAVIVEKTIENNEAYVVFRITEHTPHIIGKIILQGNHKTKEKIIRREFAFEEGDIFNRDEIMKAKQQLYRLGIFSEVAITPLDSGERINGMPVDDILVSLKEGKAGSVEFGFGYGDFEQFRGMFDVNYKNLGGYDREAGFKMEISSILQRFVFRFREPWLFNQPHLPLKIFLVKEDRRAINLDTKEVLYKVDKIGFIASTEKAVTNRLTVGLDYEYSFTDTKDVEEGVILSKEDAGTLGISSISPSLYYDTRDDPFDPTTGSFQSVVVKIASNIILSEVGFVKPTFKSAWFFPVHQGIVFAFDVRGGAAFSLDDTKELPLIERYFLGGRTTVRGYEHDMLGPKGEDDLPTGGNVFALLNAEFRFALGKGLGLVTFVDGGNVWKTITDVNEDLKYTVGAGLRYKTPVGPVRIDYGHKLSRKEDESAGEVHFSFGHAF